MLVCAVAGKETAAKIPATVRIFFIARINGRA
jgi:hypothetical protein